MLHTVLEHRRQQLAQNVVMQMMALHRNRAERAAVVAAAATATEASTPFSSCPLLPPVLYITINNHASRRLFEEKLKWTSIANVAWVRYVQIDNGKIKKMEEGGKETEQQELSTATTATTTTTATPPLLKSSYRGKTVFTKEANVAKWESWFGADILPPWDLDGRPCFALVELLERMPTFPQLFPHAIDVGTGGGSNANWLKRQGGFERVVGIDCSEKGLELARQRNHQNDVEYVYGDLFDITSLSSLVNQFDFLVDVQVFHAIYHMGTNKLVQAYAALLKKRGVALVVAGNDREEDANGNYGGGGGGNFGPSLLSKEDLIEYFTNQGLFRIAEIKEARFDRNNSDQYGGSGGSRPPLCWVCLFVRTGRPVSRLR